MNRSRFSTGSAGAFALIFASRDDEHQAVDGLNVDRLAGVGACVAARLPELTVDVDRSDRTARFDNFCRRSDHRLRAGRLLRSSIESSCPASQERDLSHLEDARDEDHDKAPRRRDRREDDEQDREQQDHRSSVESRTARRIIPSG